eukprot:SAG31_NODE_2007_length_6678_cov_3.061864_1_plen_141_part_00
MSEREWAALIKRGQLKFRGRRARGHSSAPAYLSAPRSLQARRFAAQPSPMSIPTATQPGRRRARPAPGHKTMSGPQQPAPISAAAFQQTASSPRSTASAELSPKLEFFMARSKRVSAPPLSISFWISAKLLRWLSTDSAS